MIEQRKLTDEELNRLILEAPDSETRNLLSCMATMEMTPVDFFEQYALDYFGLVANGRPIYVAILTKNNNEEFEFWTIVNTEVKEKFSLCKYAKKELALWLKKWSPIYATMERISEQNMKWVRWLGFNVDSEDLEHNLITFKIGA
jgi:hypothetical protein